MNDLILISLGLMVAAFVVGSALGWMLAARAVSHASAFERPTREPLLDAAETFTTGVVIPFKAETPAPQPAPQPAPRPAYVPAPAQPRYEMAASNVTIIRDGTTGLQTRVSSLAAMTPESVEAAVHQAGSGLAPVRLDAPKGSPDDLTLISGITDTAQRSLNELGIYHFWQVAGWTPEHVAWLSSRVEAPGRISRENWMAQAVRLADKV